MKVKPVDPAAVIRDPHTKQPIAADGSSNVPENTFWVRRFLAGEVWKLEGNEWVRRLPDGSFVRESAVVDAPVPAGSEPVAPLTTREVQ